MGTKYNLKVVTFNGELLPNLLQDRVILDVPLAFLGPNMLGYEY